MCFSPQRRAIFRHLNRQKCSKPVMFCTFWLANVRFATASGNFSTAERQKVLRRLQFFNILTFKCAFRHSGVQFFDIWTDKSAPNPSCFVHFDLQMCFSPQRRAIFRHLNRQKWSKHAVFCTFWLANVLFATAACNFWFLLWAPTSAPAALTGLLFDWPDTRIIEKTQHFATSLTFGADVSSFFWLSRYCIFCRLTWRLYCWAMHLLFNSPYCRKFLFKLPSTKWDDPPSGVDLQYILPTIYLLIPLDGLHQNPPTQNHTSTTGGRAVGQLPRTLGSWTEIFGATRWGPRSLIFSWIYP